MSDTASQNPMLRWLLIFLFIVLILSASTGLYFDATQTRPPRWVELTTPLNAVVLGVVWFFPQMSRVSLTWRRGLAGLMFLVGALELISFFY